MRKTRYFATQVSVAALLAFGIHAHARADEVAYSFNIPAEDLGNALRSFARVSHQQVVFDSATVRGKTSAALVGSFNADDGVAKLLASTNLTTRRTESGVLVVEAVSAAAAKEAAPNPHPIQTAQAEMTQIPAASRSEETKTSATASDIETVVITGTNIRGGAVTGPVFDLTRNQIETGGFSNLGQAINSLPLNFGGGINLETVAHTGINEDYSNLNLGGASSVNLRGLGSNSTLVLLDGRRLPAGGEGVSVDLSLIPLSIVNRVEVLGDGASAIYGTDAVAGVVNVITRNDYNGFDTTVRYDGIDGASPNYQVGQLGGFNWTKGNITLDYQYDSRGALPVRSRAGSSLATQPNFIYPSQTQNSGFLSANQQISPQLTAFVEGIYSDRNNYEVVNADLVTGYAPEYLTIDSNGGAVTAGLDLQLGSNWLIEGFGTYAKNNLVYDSLSGTPLAPYDTSFQNSISSGELRASGDLFSLPGGMVKSALGLSFRHEFFGTVTTGAPNVYLPRDVYAESIEINVPLVGRGNELTWLKSADLVAAGRNEHYSDFGSTFNPKIGLSLSPADGFHLKGDYSTSFRAPEGFELANSFAYNKYLYIAKDPLSSTGTSESLYLTGANAGLTPETAKNFTLTAEYQLPAAPELSMMVDYYNIHFNNRIVAPDPQAQGLSNLAVSTIQGLITRNPTAAQIQTALNIPGQIFNFTGLPLNTAAITDIVDARDQNFATTQTSGIDFSLSYTWNSNLGSWTATGAGTYIINLDNRLSPNSPFLSLVSTIYNPVDFKGRAGLSWRNGRWSAASFINYVNSYADNRVPSAVVSVSSWTTADFHLSYAFDDGLAIKGHGKTSISLDVSNLFDSAPPFVARSQYGYTYDPTNASVVGRVISLKLEKSW